MILCAGLGTRLLPVTEKKPKPLVPILNLPNVLHTLHLFRTAGIVNVILNLHHLGETIERFLGNGSRWGMRLEYSREAKLLGTGGGVKQAEPFFEGKALVIANCDFVSNLSLLTAIRHHQESDALATMVLYEDPSRQAHYSKVGTDKSGALVVFPKVVLNDPTRVGIFTGVHVLENETLKHLKAEPSGINELLYPALMRATPNRTLGHFLEHQYWRDTGEFATIYSGSMDLLRGLGEDELLKSCLREMGGYDEGKPGVWAPKGTKLPNDVEFLAPVVIGANCHLEARSSIGPFVVLADQSTVKSGATVSRTITLDKGTIEAGQTVTNALLCDGRVLFKVPQG